MDNVVFEVGDRVMIRPDSCYYRENAPANPRDVEGTITTVSYGDGTHNIYVRWDNESGNCYRSSDLSHTVVEFLT